LAKKEIEMNGNSLYEFDLHQENILVVFRKEE